MTGVCGVVLGQILLMFLYLIIGYVLYRTGLITQEGSKALAHLLLYCVLPCVVLKSFCIEYSAKGAVELAVSIAAGAGVLLLSMAVSWLFFRKDPMAQIGVAFSNAGFMGLPLVTAVLGGEAVFYAAGFVALLNALQWTYGQAKLSGDKKYIQLGAVLKNPLVLSLLGGVMIYFCRIPVPQILRTPMGAIAGMNAPLAMIVLGVYLARTDLKAIFTRPRLYALSAVRLVVIPLLTIVCLMLLPAGWRQIGIGAHHCECGSHRQQHRGICPASGAGFFLRCADGVSEHPAVADHASGDAQCGSVVRICLKKKEGKG